MPDSSSPLLATSITAARDPRPAIALALTFASGVAGLGYQIVWTQQAALWLGHEVAAVLAVVTAFFGGLAVGASALGRRIERSTRPERWYAGCEVAIAAWSVALSMLMEPVSRWLLALTGAQPTPLWQGAVAFGGTFFLLLPATASMGATLPAMERITAGFSGRPGRAIAALYAANTGGAVLGVLASAFWSIPQFGLTRTAAGCAALNLLCAIAALGLAPRASASASASTDSAGSFRSLPPARGLLALLAATGALGIGYEVLVVRVLSQVTEDTVYTFAMLLAVYLVGTALGATACRRWLRMQDDFDRLRDRLICLLAAVCLLSAVGLWKADEIHRFLQPLFGQGIGGALATEAALALAAFGLPTVMMGALFSELCTEARLAGIGLGRSLAVNTLGAAAAPILFGVLLVPGVGPKAALLLVVAGYLALLSAPARRRPAALALASAVVVASVWAPRLAFVDVPDGGHLVSYQEGALAAVSVVEDAAGVARLRIDNRQQEGSSSSLPADARQALLPLLLHPSPRRALFLGLGTGMTATSAAEDPTVQVDAVELLPEVIKASAHFTQVFADGEAPARLHAMSADARRYVRTVGPSYDVIVSDNFHPARSGSGALYTVEHFQAVRDRLTAGGVFCQWLPLHQLDLDTLRSIVRAFLAVNPGAAAMLATNSLDTPVLGLVARRDAGRFDLSQARARLAGAALRERSAEFGITDEFALLGSFVAGPSSLAAFVGGAPLNTDDHPVVAYRAPRITYAPDSLPRDRLIELLSHLEVKPGEVVDAGAEASFTPRLSAYRAARDRFIGTGRNVRPSADVREMLAQVRDPLLSVLRISPDFRPAYDPLLRMAAALGRADLTGSRALLSELANLQPARPEAGDALRRLAAGLP